MMPIGPLMIEHRRIERMLKVMHRELHSIEKSRILDPVFIDIAVDFIRTYADRCHHGKEEDILFRELDKRPLSIEHKRTMGELIEDHKWGREATGRLMKANQRYREGDEGALSVIVEVMGELIDFYPKHIEKEDKRFFLPVMKYFDEKDKDAMLKEEYEFDRMLIHHKYEDVVRQSEEKRGL